MSVDLPDSDETDAEHSFSEEDLAFFRGLQDSDNETLRKVGEVVVQSSTMEETNS